MSSSAKSNIPPFSFVDILTAIPFTLVHLSIFAVVFVGFEWWYPLMAVASYYVRMFGITGVYHRYFSHRGYKTSRVFQFLLAFLGGSSAQKGALWWAAHHRHHHKHSDQEEDAHSPLLHGILWAHVGWILNGSHSRETRHDLVKDWSKYPELVFLNNFHWIPPATLGVGMWLIGSWEWLMWGFVVPTVFLWHGTFTINSLAHVFGRRRFETTDTSRNSFLLSMITIGEGWHNNHHRYPSTANNGFYRGEVDITYYVLVMLSWLGLVWDLKTPPERILEEGRLNDERRRRLAAGLPVEAVATAPEESITGDEDALVAARTGTLSGVGEALGRATASVSAGVSAGVGAVSAAAAGAAGAVSSAAVNAAVSVAVLSMPTNGNPSVAEDAPAVVAPLPVVESTQQA